MDKYVPYSGSHKMNGTTHALLRAATHCRDDTARIRGVHDAYNESSHAWNRGSYTHKTFLHCKNFSGEDRERGIVRASWRWEGSVEQCVSIHVSAPSSCPWWRGSWTWHYHSELVIAVESSPPAFILQFPRVINSLIYGRG